MKLTASSALDLTLNGSVGSFKVGAPEGRESFEVKYLLSHVGLNFKTGSDEKLLTKLAPVREMFDFRSLDFNEIMQRDIDDARVSGELIPYILDESSSELVKFFPPIVVVALPIKDDADKPLDFYPKVTSEIQEVQNDPNGVSNWLITQAGELGQEVFKFEQPYIDETVFLHDLVTLKINTSKCKLVIVDGQHRAMALLALYRNLKDDWSDARRKPFESYYREWTPDYIRSFNLSEIKLPMIICTVPSLDAAYGESSGEYDLKKASRSIFLTLNKNARKVSEARNKLLNDGDLVASFMRKMLSKIKDRQIDHAEAMEIHNVELDQAGDRQQIGSPMAYTGVPHLYYIVEHLLLDDGDVDGITKRSGRFASRSSGSYFENALNRLNCEDVLGADAYGTISRNVFTNDDEQALSVSFMKTYGDISLQALSNFAPYVDFAKATLWAKNKSEGHADPLIHPMLFSGQGIARVFEDHRTSLKHKLKEGFFSTDTPKIRSFCESLDSTSKSLALITDEFFEELTKRYLSSLPSSSFINGNQEIEPLALKYVGRLYNEIYTSVAFQAGLICGFFQSLEKCSKSFDGELNLDHDQCFTEYLNQLNKFFKPDTFLKLTKLVSILFGAAEGTSFANLVVTDRSKASFRSVVFPGEMSPDEWPKYRYLMLEIWSPTDNDFNDALEEERNYCRKQILASLYKRNLLQYSRDNNRSAEDLTKAERSDIMDESYTSYKEMLKKLGKASALKTSIKSEALDE